jgi:hypothetical protein
MLDIVCLNLGWWKMANRFTDYTYNSRRENLLPTCPQCAKNDCAILIDSVLTRSWGGANTFETIPVWHCNRCEKVFGDRTSQVASIISCHVDDGGIIHIQSESCDATLFRDTASAQLVDLTFKMEQLQEQVSKQKDDILSSLKDRINNFTLV